MKVYIIVKYEDIAYEAYHEIIGIATTEENVSEIIKEEKLKDFIRNDFSNEYVIGYKYSITEAETDKNLGAHTPEELLEEEIDSRKEDFVNFLDEAEEMKKNPFYGEVLLRQKFNDYKSSF